MSIESIYRELKTEDYIQQQLSQGTAITANNVLDYISDTLENLDLTIPQFDASDYTVTEKTSSSASSIRNTFLTVREDLRVLYRHLLALSDTNQKAFVRWGLESEVLEKRLIDLEERIENLLLLAQDTEGYHSILVDNFTDTSLTDTQHTTANVDLDAEAVELSRTSSTTSSRIFLNDLTVLDDINFRIRSTVDLLSRVDAVGSTLADVFKQESKTWWTSVNMRSQKPVTCELGVRINPDQAVSINKIFVELHDSIESSAVHVTPLYSTDNRTFQQLPSTTFTTEVRTSFMFSFKSVEAQYIKFILTKVGPDISSSEDFFSYQFGFKNIIFYSQSFDTSQDGIFISKPLSINKNDGTVQEFEKLTLETCERIETNTDIKYFITTSNDSSLLLDSNSDPIIGEWVPISPVQRTEKLHPDILNIGDTIETTVGDTEYDTIDSEIVSISYDGRVITGTGISEFINPDADFTLLYKDSTTGLVTSESRSASNTPRYTFLNPSDRILNYQIKLVDDGVSGSALDIGNLTIFRNVGKRGLTPNLSTSLVREIQRGWRFTDPYYTCVIEVQNPNGLTIDVGSTSITIDGVSYSGVIGNTVLTGKSGIRGDANYDDGIHTIRVHKSNWVNITPSLTSLTALKDADPLYPYNHKLLIEGYEYGSTYPLTSEKVYTGVDFFAETIMDQVSIFDLQNNVVRNNYNVFALDLDAPKSHDSPNTTNEPTQVIVLKTDAENPDSQNERFMLRFTLVDTTHTYLRLRADLSTEDEEVSPGLLGYKIKLATQ